MIFEELISVRAEDNSLLHLGVLLDEERRVETNVPKDAPLVFWHDGSPAFDRENPVAIVGRISAAWPVLLMTGGSFVVAAGEVPDGIDGALIRLSEEAEPGWRVGEIDEELAHVHPVLGRRVWMSHPQPMRRKTRIWVAWLHGKPESILVDPGA